MKELRVTTVFGCVYLLLRLAMQSGVGQPMEVWACCPSHREVSGHQLQATLARMQQHGLTCKGIHRILSCKCGCLRCLLGGSILGSMQFGGGHKRVSKMLRNTAA